MPTIKLEQCNLTSEELLQLRMGLSVTKNAKVEDRFGVIVVPPFPHYADRNNNHVPFFHAGGVVGSGRGKQEQSECAQ
jgi:hypothetical protein